MEEKLTLEQALGILQVLDNLAALAPLNREQHVQGQLAFQRLAKLLKNLMTEKTEEAELELFESLEE